MKKILFFIFLFSSISGTSQNLKLTDIQLDSIAKIYNWKSKEFLIINFKHSSDHCFWDNNANNEAGKKWWENFYKKLDTSKTQNIYVFSDQKRAKKIIDNKIYFGDTSDFIYKTFFSQQKKDCFGLLVINKNGDYNIAFGEYSIEKTKEFLKNLSN